LHGNLFHNKLQKKVTYRHLQKFQSTMPFDKKPS
jgi:hypothetical protein